MTISEMDKEFLEKLNWPYLNIGHLDDLDHDQLNGKLFKLKQNCTELTITDIIDHIAWLPNADQFSPYSLMRIIKIASKYLAWE